MNDDQLNDLKQFIANTVSQTEVRLAERIDKLDQRVDSLEHEVRDGFAGIGEVFDQLNQRLDERDEHDKAIDQRLTKLEGQVAA
jgi:hypothetical protein